jgi:hypothetical protein
MAFDFWRRDYLPTRQLYPGRALFWRFSVRQKNTSQAPQFRHLTKSVINFALKLTAGNGLCHDPYSIEKGTPVERQGRKATGLRGNL